MPELTCACGVVVESLKALKRHKIYCPVARIQRIPGAPANSVVPLTLGHSELNVAKFETVLAPIVHKGEPEGHPATVDHPGQPPKTSIPATGSGGMWDGKARTISSPDPRPFDVIKAEIKAKAEANIKELASNTSPSPTRGTHGRPLASVPVTRVVGNDDAPNGSAGSFSEISPSHLGKSEVEKAASKLETEKQETTPKVVPAQKSKGHGEGLGHGRTRCPACGRPKSTRWPCKSCQVQAPRARSTNAYQCDQPGCTSSLPTAKGLTVHKAKIHGIHKVVCPACQKRFDTKAELAEHASLEHTPAAKVLSAKIQGLDVTVIDVRPLVATGGGYCCPEKGCKGIYLSSSDSLQRHYWQKHGIRVRFKAPDHGARDPRASMPAKEIRAAIVMLQEDLAILDARYKNRAEPGPCYGVTGGNDYSRLE